ncbi:hypothetical protein IW140_001200 [Coemansia sp. RSA 1813]|nr:hypothetical protein LPJ74_001719 [Coemansia sp. RSA 1843]KAJ2216849.1 hypothetical protein EV179_000883 [Coemansia sp. RSA 487]KAJ2571851.1 hypothetical protein IW140_001200 [Coemansia sp. RSA 1813]
MESDDGASDSDDLTASQMDRARERLNRDKARNAIKKEQVHMEGFLYKKSGGATNKAWNKRWCVLRSQALLIYKHFNEGKLKRIIRADEIADVHRVERRNHSFAFEVETPERTFFFEASSEQELDTWINRLRAVVASAAAASGASDGYGAGTASCPSTRTSAESRADSHRPNSVGSGSRAQFATTSRATAPSAPVRDVVPDAFMSLPSVSGGNRPPHQPMRLANPIFPHEEGDIAKSDQQLAEEANSESNHNLYASMPNALGLKIETSQAVVRKHSLQAQSGAGTEALTAFPPGIDTEHEPAAVGEECGEEEEEEPNFNVDQRKEIETRLDEDRVVMRGFLLKQDKLRQWRRRWFVLRQNTLSYYADDKEYEVKQILRRSDIHDIRGPDPSTAKAKSLHRTYFKVVAAKRNYWLAHDDATKAREWFNALVLWKAPTSASAPQPATTGLMLPVAIRHSMSTQMPGEAGAKSLFPQPIQRVQSAGTPPQQALSLLGVRRKGSNISKGAAG